MLRILHDTKYDFIKYWKTAVIATAGFIVLGLALMMYHKGRTGHYLNYSVEFTGGAVVQLGSGRRDRWIAWHVPLQVRRAP